MPTEGDLGQIALQSESLLVGGTALAALLAFFRWLLGLVGARQDARIQALEIEREQERNRMMAITQALYRLMAIVERHDPNAPALVEARTILTKAFPADAPDMGGD
ncbi:MAG: hypothetical protein EBU31_00425 [Proteobacteria bacterium]|nr:hypothetical protein [Pseudomonadota bacterium]